LSKSMTLSLATVASRPRCAEPSPNQQVAGWSPARGIRNCRSEAIQSVCLLCGHSVVILLRGHRTLRMRRSMTSAPGPSGVTGPARGLLKRPTAPEASSLAPGPESRTGPLGVTQPREPMAPGGCAGAPDHRPPEERQLRHRRYGHAAKVQHQCSLPGVISSSTGVGGDPANLGRWPGRSAVTSPDEVPGRRRRCARGRPRRSPGRCTCRSLRRQVSGGPT
jgi:hypothetical protein